MRRQFEEGSLGAPPVPPEFAPSLAKGGEWFYTTRPDIEHGRMYSPPDYAAEAVAGQAGDYVAVCHVGQGVNSFEIVYHVMYGQLALFTGTAWGGGYMDPRVSSAAVREMCHKCAELLSLFQSARDRLPPLPHRLIVVDEEFSGLRVCEWLDERRPTNTASWEWLGSSAPMERGAVAAAIRLLSGVESASQSAE